MLMPAPRPAAVTSPLPALTVTWADLGYGDGEVDAAAGVALRLEQHGVAADGQVRRLSIEDLLGVGVGVGVGHFVRLHLDGGAIARGDADVAARILDLDSGVGGNLLAEQLLVDVVLGQAEGVEEVIAVARSNG